MLHKKSSSQRVMQVLSRKTRNVSVVMQCHRKIKKHKSKKQKETFLLFRVSLPSSSKMFKTWDHSPLVKCHQSVFIQRRKNKTGNCFPQHQFICWLGIRMCLENVFQPNQGCWCATHMSTTPEPTSGTTACRQAANNRQTPAPQGLKLMFACMFAFLRRASLQN